MIGNRFAGPLAGRPVPASHRFLRQSSDGSASSRRWHATCGGAPWPPAALPLHPCTSQPSTWARHETGPSSSSTAVLEPAPQDYSTLNCVGLCCSIMLVLAVHGEAPWSLRTARLTPVTTIVIRGIFLLRKKEPGWFYEGGGTAIFPDDCFSSSGCPSKRCDSLRCSSQRTESRVPHLQLQLMILQHHVISHHCYICIPNLQHHGIFLSNWLVFLSSIWSHPNKPVGTALCGCEVSQLISSMRRMLKENLHLAMHIYALGVSVQV